MAMHRALILALLLLALFGIADSWYLYQSAVTDTALVCDIGAALDGCNVVAQSPYSKVFGVPLALLGVVFYAFMLVLVAAAAVLKHVILYRITFAFSVLGVLASAVFVYIQVALIQALCIYCLASAAVALVMCGLAWCLLMRPAPSNTPQS